MGRKDTTWRSRGEARSVTQEYSNAQPHLDHYLDRMRGEQFYRASSFSLPPTTIACNTLSLQADNLDSASRPTRMFPTIAVKFKCNMLSRLNTNDNQSHSTSRTLVHIICSFFLSLFCPSTLLYVSQCGMGVPVRLHWALSILGPGGGWGNSCKVEHGQLGRVPCITILCWTPCIYSMIPKGTASKGRPESSQPHVGVTKSS